MERERLERDIGERDGSEKDGRERERGIESETRKEMGRELEATQR